MGRKFHSPEEVGIIPLGATGIAGLLLATLVALPLPRTAQAADITPVLLGGISNTTSMADAASMHDILASRRIGLYIHPYAPNMTWGPTRTKAVTALFGHERTTGIELGWNFRRASTAVRIRNDGRAPAALAPHLVFADRTGAKWDAVLPGATMLDGSTPCIDPARYSYIIPPGASCTIDVRSETIGMHSLAANAIDRITSPALDLTILSSLAVQTQAGVGPASGKVGQDGFGSTGFWTSGTLGGLIWYRSLGIDPTQASVNIENDTSLLPADVADWMIQVKAAHAAGFTSVAPILQPSWWFHMRAGTADFAVDPYMINFRRMALGGGAIAIDSPPSWVRQVWGPAYLDYIETMIRWSVQRKIRFTWIASPYAPKANSFLDDTSWILSRLKADHLRPSQWVVENYEFANANSCSAIGTANDTTKATVSLVCNGNHEGYAYKDSLNHVALILAASTSGEALATHDAR